ncbi:MAG: hypothetical protein EOO44_10935 [Flavobacterium sp.]|nr:MAG: hypothetical protein EOO44_10935 [Flavobacterium sp.]
MVIIADKVGQLCNQLFQFSYFITNSIDNGYEIVNPYFDEYAQFFEATSTNSYFGYRISTKITLFKIIDKFILKYFLKVKPIFPNLVNLDIRGSEKNYYLQSVEFKQNATQKIVFVKGWLFKDDENLRKYRDVLLEIFKPKPKYNYEAKQNILQLREKFDCIIGVHIRRGDYKTWNNGKYYFSDEIYLQKMIQLQNELELQNKSCCFFICSNEPIDEVSFKNLNKSINTRHFIVDLYSLANCDYIIGPPSTFSLWAAFYGNIPFLIIENENTEIRLNKFTYY